MSASVSGEPLIRRHAPEPEFDRAYFNLHGPDREAGFLVMGVGVYPASGIEDGYVCFVRDEVQHNLRFSQHLDPSAPARIGPFGWQTDPDGQRWRLRLGANPTGLEFDLTWEARAPLFSVGEYSTGDDQGASSYDHWFQSGRYSGSLGFDGEAVDISGFLGQRDRSRGARRVRDRLGMHLWLQAQMPEYCLGLLFNLARDGEVAHMNGAVMRESGELEPVTVLSHDLDFAADFELRGGRLGLEAGGRPITVAFESTGRGIYMQGGGYDGRHGIDQGRTFIAAETWPLDGSRNPRNLSLGITDAHCRFEIEGEPGSGIVEYALTRSPQYSYRADSGMSGQGAK